MMPVPIAADDLVLDVLLISHDHPDHLDADSIRALCMHDKTRVLASHVSSDRLAAEFSIAPDKLTRLSPGDSVLLQSLTVQATRADHGALCPDALGFVLDFGFARIYYAGDTAYNRSLQQEIQRISPDVALLPINGA